MPIKWEYSANLFLIVNTAPNPSCPSRQWTASMTSFPDSKTKINNDSTFYNYSSSRNKYRSDASQDEIDAFAFEQ